MPETFVWRSLPTDAMKMFMGKYTTIGSKWHLHPDVVKRDLNASLGKL